MRIIDADKILERLQEWNTSDDMNKTLYRFTFNRIMEQPTAYDVDKVVERLKELNKYNLNLADCMLDIQSHGLNRHFICLEDAIEIVKAGGIDETNS
jgi:hypothetical protein